jgi:hypothetical protein
MLRGLLIVASLQFGFISTAQQPFSPEKEALKLFDSYKPKLKKQMTQ